MIGQGEYTFNIELSLSGSTTEWIYSKPNGNGIQGVCTLVDDDLPIVLDDSKHTFTSSATQISINRWVLVMNVHSHIAAIRLTSIIGNNDHTLATVKFVYAIFGELAD